MVSPKIQKFQQAANEIASSLKARLSGDLRIKINTHTDPDGISAACILSKCLNYYDIPFHVSFGSPPETEDLEKLERQNYDLFIFLDQGSGQFQIIEEYLLNSDEEVLIFDHHPGKITDNSNLSYLNPHEFGLEGARDVSASGVVYSVIEKIDERFECLSELALIGALGDRQETSSGFVGINQKIFDKAMERGFLSIKKGLKLDGRSMQIVDCLSHSIRPFLLGLSGEENSSRSLIKELDLDPENTLDDLESDEESSLREGILESVENDLTKDFRRSLWGNIYVSELNQIVGPQNFHEYVTILDACEKLGQIGVGFSAMMGDSESRDKALGNLRKYQKNMIETIDWITSEEEMIKTTSQMRYIDFGDKLKSKMAGEVLSVAIESGLVGTDLPVFGLARSDEDTLKISVRAPPEYAESGADLGEVMEKVSKQLGGSGGGHSVAAAARLPIERKDEFLTKVAQVLENLS